MRMRFRQQGVTLIELMVTIAVLAVLATLAAPSFADFRERQALRGAADNFVAAIGVAKEEAVKRDSFVRVDFKAFGANGVCMGAVAVASPTASGCDCAGSAASCTVALFPETANDLQKVQLAAGGIGFTDDGFVIDPKTATLYNLAGAGQLTLATSRGYQAAVQVNVLARPVTCTPSGASKTLPGVKAC
jgi:type IV fimbrial biogenesis protein FimT